VFWTHNKEFSEKRTAIHAYYATTEGNRSVCKNNIFITTLPEESEAIDKTVCRTCRKILKRLEK
jgi:hypothetical protein